MASAVTRVRVITVSSAEPLAGGRAHQRSSSTSSAQDIYSLYSEFVHRQVGRVAHPTSAEHARLGRALRAIRNEADRTIDDVAREAGLNPRYLAGVERGEINIALTNLLKTTSALGTSLRAVAQRAEL